MPRTNKKKKSRKLKQLEEKLKILQKEIARREKRNTSATARSIPSSPVKTTKRRKPTKTVFAECQSILDRIKRITYSKPFLVPVDWKAMNIPRYPQIIKNPMDLQTVQTKLKNSSYATPYDFAKDMRLIYQNAQTFNKPHSAYFQSSQKFAKKFEEEYEKKIIDLHETNEFTRRIHKVMSCLIKREDSSAFRAPVNPQVLDIPDYHDVIEEPMDLGTILNKIHRYTLFKTFCADLFLVWDNCCRYNPKQNMIHQTALRLRDYTTRQLGRLCSSDFEQWKDDEEESPDPYDASSLLMTGQTRPTSKVEKAETIQSSQNSVIKPMALDQNLFGDTNEDEDDDDVHMESVGKENDEDEDEEEEESMPDIFNRCDEIEDDDERNKLMISHLMEKEQLNPDIVVSLDLAQKEELQRGIQCLDSDHFDPLVNMLQSFIPDGENEDDEVELDVDSIDAPLQVKMYNYMLQAIRQQETERLQREGGNAPTQNVGITEMNNEQNKEETQQQQQQQQQPQQEQQQMQTENVNEQQQQQEAQMMEVEQEEQEQNEQQQEEVENLPNVVNAFPISISEPMQNEENEAQNKEKEDENGNGNINEQSYANLFGQEDDDQNENDENENENNVDIEMETHVNNDADDIIADIANVIATETDKTPSVDPSINISDSMPQMPANEEKEEKENNEEPQVQNEEQMDSKENENENVSQPETVNEAVPTMPTMPKLQSVDAVENEQQTEESKNDNDIQINQATSEEINPIEAEQQINNATEQTETTSEQEEGDEDEDVDTPLADDIEF